MADLLGLFPSIPGHVLIIADHERPWMMHGQQGTRVRLNIQALAQIRACNGEHTVSELIEMEARRCHLPAERVRGGVLRLLEGLHAADLLEFHTKRLRFTLETISLELTNQCNLFCRHCAYGHRVNPALRAYLPLPLIERVVLEMAEMGGSEVFLTGGEPTLHPDFLEIVEACKAQELRVVVQTNGIRLAHGAIDRLRRVGVDRVQVSLDGVTPETNDAIRGKGAYARATATLRRMQTAGLPLAVSFTACKINKPEWERLGELREALDVDTLLSGEVMIWGRAAEFEHELGLSAREIYQFRRTVLDMKAQQMRQSLPQLRVTGEGKHGYWRDMCAAGRSKCTVLHNGDLLACSMFDQPEMVAGNLHSDPLCDLWENAPVFQQLRAISVLQFEHCASCTFQYVCGGGCRAKAYMLHGDLCGLPCPLDCAWRRMLMTEMTEMLELQGLPRPANKSASKAVEGS